MGNQCTHDMGKSCTEGEGGERETQFRWKNVKTVDLNPTRQKCLARKNVKTVDLNPTRQKCLGRHMEVHAF